MFWSGGKERNHLELAGPAKWELLKSSRQQIKSLIFLFVERLGSLCVTGQSDGLVSYILNTDTRTIYLWNMEYTGGIYWWNILVECTSGTWRGLRVMAGLAWPCLTRSIRTISASNYAWPGQQLSANANKHFFAAGKTWDTDGIVSHPPANGAE